MIKIKENKEKGDLKKKERNRRRRIFQVVQAQTQEQVKLQTRKVKPLNLIAQRIKDEMKNWYLQWRKNKCEKLEEWNLKRTNEDYVRKQNMELKRIEENFEKERDNTIQQYKNSWQKKMRDNRKKGLEKWFK